MRPPPHSLHLLRDFPCSHSPPPPHSAHKVVRFLCMQRALMLHLSQSIRRISCLQTSPLMQPLHEYFPARCTQIPPPHFLHYAYTLPCLQLLPLLHSLQIYLFLSCAQWYLQVGQFNLRSPCLHCATNMLVAIFILRIHNQFFLFSYLQRDYSASFITYSTSSNRSTSSSASSSSSSASSAEVGVAFLALHSLHLDFCFLCSHTS